MTASPHVFQEKWLGAKSQIVKKSGSHLSSLAGLFTVALSLLITASSPALTLVWDSNTGTAGAQDGAGTWSTSTARWLTNGTTTPDVNWVSGSDAIIGAGSGAAGTITLSGTPVVSNLTANAAGSGKYVVSSSSLSLRGTNSVFTINADIDFGNGTGSTFKLGEGTTGAGLTKNGSGAMNIRLKTDGTVPSTYTGGTILNAGRLTVTGGSPLGTGKFTINAGTFSSFDTTAVTLTNAVDLASNATLGDATASGALTFAQGGWTIKTSTRQLTVASAVTVSNVIANDTSGAGLTKAGSATLTLKGNNTYNGNTTINAGALALAGAGSISNTPVITVAANATLDVSGLSSTFTLLTNQTLTGSGGVNGSVTAAAGAKILPGSSPGTLTFSNNLTLASGETNFFELTNAPGVSDKITVLGILTNNGCTLDLTVLGAQLNAGVYVLFEHSGALGGHFTNTPVVIHGGTDGAAFVTETAGQIRLEVGAVRLHVTLPGQIFTSGSGNSGTPAAQTAGTQFNLARLTVTDARNNTVTNYSGSKTISYSDPGGTPDFTTTVIFTNGVSSNALPVTLKRAETTTITATDGTLAGVASSSLTVNPAAFSRLQLLAPGEAAAPGTATGKTGLPLAQSAGSLFTVTVNSVDANWNIVSTNDNIHVTTTDPGDAEPANNTLSGGTRTFSIAPATIGMMTVTASDVSNGGITANTSPAISVKALARAVNTSLAMPSAPPAHNYSYTNAFPGLTFTNPVCLVSPPDETNRLFVLEKRGRIIVITNLAAPTRSVFLDITSRVTTGADVPFTDERGLLAMAFHPGYATNGYFYVWYMGTATTAVSGGTNSMHDILARYQVSTNDPNVALTNEQRFIAQYDERDNHNGGDLHFGPTDGYLYLSIGDEGDQQGVMGNVQRIDKDFFAGMFRLDVDKKSGNLEPSAHASVVLNTNGLAFYSVPVDNPFVHTNLGGDWNGMFNDTDYTALTNSIRTELWVVGLRNPFRFSFSPIDNTLYLGDVGEQAWEELDIIERGKNYGWNWFEGPLQRSNNIPSGPVPTNFVNVIPLDAYTQTNQADKYAIIAGYTYTGSKLSQLYGAFIYADYGQGNVWAIRNSGTNVTFFQQLFTDDFTSGLAGILTFGVDPSNGDILYADAQAGTNAIIKRIIYSTNTPAGTAIPSTLADTGAFTNLATLAVAPGIAPYDINVPFWSDNAVKSRWFSLPDTNQTITFNADGNWLFPTGTVWIKHFELELTNGVPASRKRLETRLLVKNDDGVYGVTYRWGNSTTNATLVAEGGQDEPFVIDDGGGILRTQVWHYPSRSECLKCHTEMGGFGLGFNTAQLNKTFGYPAATTNQLQALSDAGYFNSNVTGVASLRALAHATNTAVSLEYRARSYLAANCRQCHQGSGVAIWDANITTPLAQAGIVNGALFNNLGDTANRVIKPGSLANSVLYRRISVFDADHMPPLATSVLDLQNVALMAAWITNGIPSSLTFQTPAILASNATAQAVLLANNSSATNNVTTDPETTYTSGSPSVITVNSSGLLTAVASSGSANIIATFGAVSATNTVTAASSNQPPVAGTNTYPRSNHFDLKISITNLLAGCSDADSDPLSLIAVNTSTNGITPTTNSDYIFYTNTSPVNDRFTYVISDGHVGGVSTGLVIIQTSPAFGTNSVVSLQTGVPGPHTNTLILAGIPGYLYIVQFATNISLGPWFNLDTNTAGTNGLWMVIDPSATNAQRFYRTYSP